jgi:hypothetical protein
VVSVGIPLVSFQAYSSGVCSLLFSVFSGAGPGPCLFGSQSLHLTCSCDCSLLLSVCCWLLSVCEFVKKQSIVVCAGLVGHPLSCVLSC